MFTEKQLGRYADVMIWALETSRRQKFKKNDVVLIRFHLPALRLAEILYERLLEMGRNPVMRLMLTIGMERSYYEKANERQLTFIDPGVENLFRNLNGNIFLYAPESLTHLSHIAPARIGASLIAGKPMRDILDRRDEAGDFGWTLCLWPTAALAEHAGMTMEAYVRQVIAACFLNSGAPVEEWRSIHSQVQGIKRRLNRMEIQTLHIESRHTDLTIEVGEQRRWLGLSGHNIPSFEIFLSPDARGTKGIYHADQLSFRNGNRVKGITLEFSKGQVLSVKAEEGEAFLKQQIGMDHGARYVGEFSLTDRRFSKIKRFMANTLYDENYGGRHGNCHIALGSAYTSAYSGDPGKLTKKERERLGFNDSALHWDIVNTEKKRVVAVLKKGGKVTIYEDGQFTV